MSIITKKQPGSKPRVVAAFSRDTHNTGMKDSHTLPSTPRKPAGALPFVVADAVYLLMVFSWMIFLPPLGRDFISMARPNTLEPAAGALFRGCMHIFGANAWPYHVFNLLLLYVCMLLIFVLTRRLTGGPWWLGSVAAVLFMANPVKTEAVVHLDGLRDLLPALTGLTAFLSYITFRSKPGTIPRCVALALFMAAAAVSPSNLMLMPVFAVYEAVYRPEPRGWRFYRPFAIVGTAAILASGIWAHPGALHPLRMFLPLWLIFYPVGMLPENAELLSFSARPVDGAALALFSLEPFFALVFVFVAITAIGRTLKRLHEPAITFGVLGAVAFRLFQGGHPVDPVTLQGGGGLLIPLALLSVAAAGACRRLMQFPEWRRHVVRLSTALCILLMVLQIMSNLEWRRAARDVERFRTMAAQVQAEHPGKLLAVLPDYQFQGTAPLQLSLSVRYNTLFDTALPVQGLFATNRISGNDAVLLHYARDRIELEVYPRPDRSAAVLRLFPGPWRRNTGVANREKIVLNAEKGLFPEVYVPFP